MNQNIKIINGIVFYENQLIRRDLCIEEGLFVNKQSYKDDQYEVIDAKDMVITPGFIDTHIHGAFGSDTSDAISSGIENMATNLYKFGVVAFCPTTMALSEDTIVKCFESVLEAKKTLESREVYSQILGVHLEGPLLNKAKSAAQDETTFMDLVDGDLLLSNLIENFPNLIRIVSFAPELTGANEFITKYKDICSLSLAHTNSDYATANKAFELGANSVTHLLNAMSELSKRAPGIPAAAYDNDSFVELICDGKHIEAPVLRILFKIYNDDRIVVVSDSMRGAGSPDGEYMLGTTKVMVKNNRTYFGPEGNLAGSVSNLAEEYKVLCDSGIDRIKIIKALTINPLKRMRMNPDDLKLGLIKEGYRGSVNVFDLDNNLKLSIIDGKVCY